MDEIRCGNCRRKLAEGIYSRLAIKCPRCGAFNQLSAQSATPERQGAPRNGASWHPHPSFPGSEASAAS